MTPDPVVTALLRRLVELRPAPDPLRAFAATVLSGEATLRAAADHPAFAEAFTEALTAAATEGFPDGFQAGFPEAAALRRWAADQEAG
jgi:hypothetical protein